LYVRVAIGRPMRGLLTYALPPELVDKVRVGHVVLVPLGARGGETAYVVELLTEPDIDPARVKLIRRLVDPEPGFDARQLVFFRWIADYYLAPLGQVIATALPSEVKARVVSVAVPTDVGVEALTRGELEPEPLRVLREVISRPGLTRRGLVRRLEGEAETDVLGRALDALVRRGQVVWAEREVHEQRGLIRTVALVPDAEAIQRLPANATRMRAVIDALAARGALDVGVVVAEQGESVRPALQRLAQLGIVKAGTREDREALHEVPALGASRPPVLNEDQRAALAALTGSDAEAAFLLWGVTGSGKTEVFLGAAEATLARGRQVLVLVPEIALTPQLVGRFRARFGDSVAVLHSGLVAPHPRGPVLGGGRRPLCVVRPVSRPRAGGRGRRARRLVQAGRRRAVQRPGLGGRPRAAASLPRHPGVCDALARDLEQRPPGAIPDAEVASSGDAPRGAAGRDHRSDGAPDRRGRTEAAVRARGGAGAAGHLRPGRQGDRPVQPPRLRHDGPVHDLRRDLRVPQLRHHDDPAPVRTGDGVSLLRVEAQL
jgi:hypothetical protein